MARVRIVTPPSNGHTGRSPNNRGSDSRSCGDNSEEHSSPKKVKTDAGPAKGGLNTRMPTPARGRPPKRPNSTQKQSDESGDDEGSGEDSGDASDDESEGEDKQPGVLAPSGVVRRNRNRQTGLSISLSRSSLSVEPELEGKKRGRSPASSGNAAESRPTKLSKIASSASALLSSSDDDIYNAVDLISDSEDDKDVEQMEEFAIMASEDEFTSTANLGLPSAPDDLNTDENPHFNEHFAQAKRVHWADDVFYCETDGSQTVAPNRRDSFGEDETAINGVEEGQAGVPIEWAVEPPADQASDLDWGDTTDEESMPLQTVHRPNERLHDVRDHGKLKARRRSSLSAYRPPPNPGRFEGPSLGSWVADPTKPIAVTDLSGTRLVYFPPQGSSQASGSQQDLTNAIPASPKAKMMACILPVDDGSETEEEDGVNSSFQDTVLGPVADQMYSDFQQGAERIKQVLPGTSRSGPGFVQKINAKDWDETEDDDDEAGEKHLRIQDLIDLSDSSSESGDGQEESDPNSSLKESAVVVETVPVRVSSSSPDPLSGDSPAWPALHRPSRSPGHKKERHRASLSPSQTRASAKLATKLQGMNASPNSKRLKARH